MTVFHKGDPVLIIGGIDEEHRKLIGHGTTVTSELIQAMPPDSNQPMGVHKVTESYAMEPGSTYYALCYRPSELMPLQDKAQELSRVLANYGLNKMIQDRLGHN